jgi:hypothetical protein
VEDKIKEIQEKSEQKKMEASQPRNGQTIGTNKAIDYPVANAIAECSRRRPRSRLIQIHPLKLPYSVPVHISLPLYMHH